MKPALDSAEPPRRLFGLVTISDSIVLAAFPLSAYLISFLYQAGYLNAFRLPTRLIEFDLIDVLLVTVGLWGLITILFGIFNLIFTLLTVGRTSIPEPVARRLRGLSPLYFITISLFYLYSDSLTEWLILWVAAGIGSAIAFLPPLLTRKHKGSYLEKMKALDDSATPSTDPVQGSLVDIAYRLLGYRGFVAIVYFGLFLFVSYHAGRAEALRQEDFYVTDASPESAVLYWLSDGAIIAPFNRQTRQLEGQFSVISIPGDDQVSFQLERVGPLRPQPTPTRKTSPTITAIPTHVPAPAATMTALPSTNSISTATP